MKKEIKTFVGTCAICQQAKPERMKYPSLLAPLPIPDKDWKHISMDFIEGIMKSSSFDYIMVVIDRFSKYTHFIPLSHPFSDLTSTHAYMNNIYKLHGMPKSVVSNQDMIFTCTF